MPITKSAARRPSTRTATPSPSSPTCTGSARIAPSPPTYPDGTTRTLIRIDRWDFNWQATYDFAEPVPLPKGTTLEMVAHFDNSEANPNNQSRPPREVRWGEQTTDEMCIGFLQYTNDAEQLDNQPPARFRTRTLADER